MHQHCNLEKGTNLEIAWEGITDTTKVELAFSSDNGRNWNTIFDSLNRIETNWVVPYIVSDSCLIMIKQGLYIEEGVIE